MLCFIVTVQNYSAFVNSINEKGYWFFVNVICAMYEIYGPTLGQWCVCSFYCIRFITTYTNN